MRIRPSPPWAAALLVLLLPAAFAADDPKLAREQEMLRRTQEALRQSQADNSELAQSKAQAEAKLKSANDEIDAAHRASKSANDALRGQLRNAGLAQDELTRKLDAANKQLAAQERQSTADVAQRDVQVKQLQQQLEASRAAINSCEAKNLRLYQYSQEMAQRYKQKGVWASVTQQEPFTGIKEVGIENLLQEYQGKLDSQRIKPSAPP
jgi:chromosome segregation ATPase